MRRLLADARHDGPVPGDVVARLDRVLADLRAEAAGTDTPAAEGLHRLHPRSRAARRGVVGHRVSRLRRRGAVAPRPAGGSGAGRPGHPAAAPGRDRPGRGRGRRRGGRGRGEPAADLLGRRERQLGGLRGRLRPRGGNGRLVGGRRGSGPAPGLRRGPAPARPVGHVRRRRGPGPRPGRPPRGTGLRHQPAEGREPGRGGLRARGRRRPEHEHRGDAVEEHGQPAAGRQVVDLYACGGTVPLHSADLPVR